MIKYIDVINKFTSKHNLYIFIFNIIKTRHSIKTIKKYVNEIVSLLNPNSDNLDFSPNNFGANKNVTQEKWIKPYAIHTDTG